MFRVSFIDEVFKIGKKRPLTLKDLGKNPEYIKPSHLYSKFMSTWEKRNTDAKGHKSFTTSILRATGLCNWAAIIILNAISAILSFIPSLILKILVSDLEKTSPLSMNQSLTPIF